MIGASQLTDLPNMADFAIMRNLNAVKVLKSCKIRNVGVNLKVRGLTEKSRADKWYALVWYHVCPLAWLKMIKLCSCLSYFSGFFGHFESLAFFENRVYQSSQTWYFSQFLKHTTIKWQFFKKAQLFLLKNEDKPNSRYLSKVFQQKSSSLWKNCGFLDSFLGTKVTAWICGWWKLWSKPIKLIWMLCLFQK